MFLSLSLFNNALEFMQLRNKIWIAAERNKIAIFCQFEWVFSKKKKQNLKKKALLQAKLPPPRPVNGKCLSLALPRSILTLDG